MTIFTSYIALGALIFFGYYIKGVKEHWFHLSAFQLTIASILLLLLWGPLLIIEVIKRVYTR